MNWNAAIRTLCLVTLTGFGCWALVHVGRAADALRAPDVEPTIAKANAAIDKVNGTLDALNKPCYDLQGDWICGPIPQLSQTEKNIGILAARSAQQVQQTGTLVTAVAHNLDTVGDSVKTVAGRLSTTADAATGLLHTTSTAMDKLNDDKSGLSPLLAAYTGAGNDMDALIKGHAVNDTLTNLQFTTQNVAGVTLDLRQVADKETADYLKPTKWYMVPAKRAGEFIDIGSAVARNIP